MNKFFWAIYIYTVLHTYNMYLLEESMSLLHVNVNIYKGEVDLWILKEKKGRKVGGRRGKWKVERKKEDI